MEKPQQLAEDIFSFAETLMQKGRSTKAPREPA